MRDYFGGPLHYGLGMVTQDQIDRIVAAVKEQTEAKIKQETQAQIDALREESTSFRKEATLEIAKMRQEMISIFSSLKEPTPYPTQSPVVQSSLTFQNTKGSNCFEHHMSREAFLE